MQVTYRTSFHTNGDSRAAVISFTPCIVADILSLRNIAAVSYSSRAINTYILQMYKITIKEYSCVRFESSARTVRSCSRRYKYLSLKDIGNSDN